MTNETKNRIKTYTKLLPGMKERVFATATILTISVLLFTVASFAWITISRSPVASGIQTTLSSNGSLEIALSPSDGSQPNETDIDESATSTYDVTVSNLTWGNLINLYDERYGIENLALRPAQLNSGSLLTQPLKAAAYGSDGRVNELISDFAYAKYDTEKDSFITANNFYGVRAIASYTKTITEGTQATFEAKLKAVSTAQDAVYAAYDKVPGSFSGLGTLLSRYAQAKVDASSYSTGGDTNPNLASYLGGLITLYKAYVSAMKAQAKAVVALANFQSYVYSNNNGTAYTEVTWDDLAANPAQYNVSSSTETSTNGVISLVNFTQFVTDYNDTLTDYEKMQTYQKNYKINGTAYYWSEGGDEDYNIADFLDRLVDYPTMQIDMDGTKVNILSLQSAGAEELLAANGTNKDVYVTNGTLKRFEQYAVSESYRLNGRGACTISIKAAKAGFTVSVTIYGKAYTDASGTDTFSSNVSASTVGSTLVANDSAAEDNYGIAIDFWLRTNAESTCVTLEGATTIDENGNTISYDGINRIWGATGTKNLTTESTTQGGGSCYIYYADTPEDAERSKNILEAMKIVFVDENGKILATASMDTGNIYAVNGRFTVPVVLDNNSGGVSYTYTNDNNEETIGYGITTIYNDVPIRVEALIYLDGTHLENTDVLSDAEIQGQLNIQFGSSEALQVTGGNEIKNDTRSVSATLTKTTMDYDNAINDDDLTTDVTLTVQGTDSTVITGFFVRAISSTQGSREETITFTKQDDGKWTSSYKFNAPGTYYLRHVRLDGIDYALAEPCKVEISGFSLKSVSWGEPGDTATIQTSENTYDESVTVQFATSDRSKMPKTVSARFMEEDSGAAVNIPLSYSSGTGKWTGTGTFQTSGTYKFSYLIFDGKYKDLESEGMLKTITLKLGMYAVITDRSGKIEEEFSSGTSYPRELGVQIFDNTDQAISDITGVRLYYSNGGSSSNTINSEMTWDATDQAYTGEIVITKAGRYTFSSVLITQTGGSTSSITRTKEETPVYRIYSPDPPIYDTSSVATYNSSVQFVPLTNDAVIDGLKIANSESASLSAVVYNDQSKEYYDISTDEETMIYTGSSWNIQLPSYTLDVDGDDEPLEDATYTQEGKWSLVVVKLWDCYDSSGDSSGELRESDNPIVWAGDDKVSEAYLSANGITETDAKYDFSSLSTLVSCTINCEFTPGKAELGSSTTPFMTSFYIDDIGMYALFTDDSGRVIPSDKITEVQLKIKYNPPTSSADYGYKVQSGASQEYIIYLNSQDEESGYCTVSDCTPQNYWQYVGPYAVVSLTVSISGNIITYIPSSGIGLPSQYTVTTAGPSSDNIRLLDDNIKQRYTTIGKSASGSAIIGTFLQGGDLGVTAKISVVTDDDSDTSYVVLDDVSMQLVFTYQGGSEENGGYTVSDDNSLRSITMDLTNNNGTYSSSSTKLLAGTYSLKLNATVNGVKTSKDLNDISVYSKAASLEVTGVSPETSESFEMNTYTGEDMQLDSSANYVGVQNYYSEELANVYIKAETTTWVYESNTSVTADLVDYTLPTVSVTISNVGTNFNTASISISGNSDEFSYTPSTLTDTAEIGNIGSSSYELSNGGGTCSSDQTINVPYETRTPLGEKTVNSITLTDSNGTYVMTTANSITIREKNEAPASLSYVTADGYNSVDSISSIDGGDLKVTLPSSIGTTTGDYKKTDDSVDWATTSTQSQYLCYYTVKSSKSGGTTSSGTCSKTYTGKWTTTWTYYKYTRTTTIEKKTSSTTTYRATYGLTGWTIDGVTYSPGQTVTITGAKTAIPVIGILSETQIGTPTTTTMQRTTVADTYTGSVDGSYTSTKSGYSSSSAALSAAQSDAEGRYAEKKPSGYSWFNSSSPKTDGHYTTAQVEEVTLS